MEPMGTLWDSLVAFINFCSSPSVSMFIHIHENSKQETLHQIYIIDGESHVLRGSMVHPRLPSCLRVVQIRATVSLLQMCVLHSTAFKPTSIFWTVDKLQSSRIGVCDYIRKKSVVMIIVTEKTSWTSIWNWHWLGFLKKWYPWGLPNLLRSMISVTTSTLTLFLHPNYPEASFTWMFSGECSLLTQHKYTPVISNDL